MTLLTWPKAAMKRSLRSACSVRKRFVMERALFLEESHSPSIECRRACTSSYCSSAFMFGAMPSSSLTALLSSAPSSFSVCCKLSLRPRYSSPLKSMRTISSDVSPLLAGASGPASPSKVAVPTRPLGLNDSLASSSPAALLLADCSSCTTAASCAAMAADRLRLPLPLGRTAADWSGSLSGGSRGSSTSSSRARWKALCRLERNCSNSVSICVAFDLALLISSLTPRSSFLSCFSSATFAACSSLATRTASAAVVALPRRASMAVSALACCAFFAASFSSSVAIEAWSF
mmetsp:Transcript_43429/g.72214  ORF Transcript_43429/g.72214 Transcript_43429/m.72214 type:complete len:290 (-) Transcript_43429:2577-3446(-)